MRHPEFPVISFLVIPFLLSSLPSHFRARSVCTIALIAWLTVMNLIRGINSLVWANNVVIKLEVWCDITTKLLIGFTFAVPLAAFCICRHLESIASNRQAVTTIADKHRRMRFEALMCFGVPIIFMALHYVVQGHRFDLIEDIGCSPNTYSSVPGLFVVWIPPLVISSVSLVYAVLAIRHFLRRRVEFAAILQSSNAAISPGRYLRLMAFAIVEIIWDSGTNLYILWFNINSVGLRPWISWENVHSNFSRVGVFPTFLLPSSFLTQVIWQWWIVPLSSIMVFIFFGFGTEAMSDYYGAILWVRRKVLRQQFNARLAGNLSVLPNYHPGPPGNINVSFSKDISMEEVKSWDDSYFKEPGVLTHVSSPSTPSSTMTPTDHELKCGSKSRPLEDSRLENTSFISHSSQCFGLSSSTYHSEQSSLTSPSYPIRDPQAYLPPTSACTTTVPEGQSSPSPLEERYSTASVMQLSRDGDPRSISSEFGFNVSDANLPRSDNIPCQEEILLTPPSVVTSSSEMTHPHGGIHVMVQRDYF